MSFQNLKLKGVVVGFKSYRAPALELSHWNGSEWEVVDVLPLEDLHNSLAKTHFLDTIKSYDSIGADLINAFLAEAKPCELKNFEIVG